MRSSKSRSRNKSNRQRTLGNIVNRVFDSSGPEGKVRGTPQQIIEKYLALARDAQLSNDRVAEQSFLQHAEHYTRMLGEAQREQAERQQQFSSQRDEDGQDGAERSDQGGNFGNGGNGNGNGRSNQRENNSGYGRDEMNRENRDHSDRRDNERRDNDRRDNRDNNERRENGRDNDRRDQRRDRRQDQPATAVVADAPQPEIETAEVQPALFEIAESIAPEVVETVAPAPRRRERAPKAVESDAGLPDAIAAGGDSGPVETPEAAPLGEAAEPARAAAPRRRAPRAAAADDAPAAPRATRSRKKAEGTAEAEAPREEAGEGSTS